MDKLKTIISNNEKNTEQYIFSFIIMFAMKVSVALIFTILIIKYCYNKEWVYAIIEGTLAIIWCANIVIEIKLLLLKIKSSSKIMSLDIQYELVYQNLKMLNDIEKAVRFGEEETE